MYRIDCFRLFTLTQIYNDSYKQILKVIVIWIIWWLHFYKLIVEVHDSFYCEVARRRQTIGDYTSSKHESAGCHEKEGEHLLMITLWIWSHWSCHSTVSYKWRCCHDILQMWAKSNSGDYFFLFFILTLGKVLRLTGDSIHEKLEVLMTIKIDRNLLVNNNNNVANMVRHSVE